MAAVLTGRMTFERYGWANYYRVNYWWELENYASALIEGMCHALIDAQYMGLQNFTYPSRPTHEIWSPFCHPEYHREPYPFGTLEHGSFASNSRCIGSKNIHNYMIEYIDKFVDAYHGKAPMAVTGIFYEAHEGTADLVQSIDEDIVRLFRKLDEKGVLEDSLVILASDHGHHMTPFGFTLEARTQLYLPALFMSVPRKLLAKYPRYAKNLQENMQKPFTHYDLYWTLRQVHNVDQLDVLPNCTGADTQPRTLDMAQSIFSSLDPMYTRALEDYTFFHFNDHACMDEEFTMANRLEMIDIWNNLKEIGKPFNMYCDPNKHKVKLQ